MVEAHGGGGAGGGAPAVANSSGFGGDRGGRNVAVCTTPSGTYAITIGAGGTGVSAQPGNPGGNTTFIGYGINLTAFGGRGGGRSGSYIGVPTMDGASSIGAGGTSIFDSTGGSAAPNSAAGGGGTYTSSSTARTGGNGGSGIVFIWEYA